MFCCGMFYCGMGICGIVFRAPFSQGAIFIASSAAAPLVSVSPSSALPFDAPKRLGTSDNPLVCGNAPVRRRLRATGPVVLAAMCVSTTACRVNASASICSNRY